MSCVAGRLCPQLQQPGVLTLSRYHFRTWTSFREGDVPDLTADPTLAEKELGWKSEKDLETMCSDLWNWQSQNPQGEYILVVVSVFTRLELIYSNLHQDTDRMFKVIDIFLLVGAYFLKPHCLLISFATWVHHSCAV